MHANYASNNRKRENVKIIRIALDLHDVIVDSKKVVLFEYELACVASVSVQAKYRKPRSSVFTPKPYGNACFAG